ncbi:MAG TPA: ABC transporter ATP-binding protein [bacterium]|nr:ABC transporter ATP-binding protein [bacterium]
MTADALLSLADIHTYYGDNHVLHGVTLTVPAGEVTALLGRNGMGKTTLIRSVIGFTPPRRGRIVFAGREIQRLPSHAIARQGIGLVPQGRRIFPSLTVEEQLRVVAHGDGRWTLDRVYGLFPRLLERRGHLGGQLSGGEQQMLAIGRALMTNPALLLMDEPSEGLAPLIVRDLKDAIAQLAQGGLAILLVEQNLPLALAVAHTCYLLSRGQVVHQASAGEIAKDDEIRRRHLGV